MAAQYQAIVPLVIAKDESDRDVYIYADQIVPDNVSDESRKRLLKEKLIAVFKPVEADTGTAAASTSDTGSAAASTADTSTASDSTADTGAASAKASK